MTEEQAIERLRSAIASVQICDPAMPNRMDREAKAVWNEMKAIAQEDTTTLRFYTGKAINGSDGKELIL